MEDLSRTQIVQYAGASGDFNPLHTDAIYATEVAGFPGVFSHDMLTMGMTGRILTEIFGCVQALRHFGGRFRTQVSPGDSLTARAEVVTVDEDVAKLAVTTSNQDGIVAFSGRAVVAVRA